MPYMGIYSNALFSKAQQRVLADLFGQPDRSFYANETIALAGSGSGAVQRELARLETAALITAPKIGNQKHYQANHDATIFGELRGIVLKTFGVTDVLRIALQALWPQIELAFVYGSLTKSSEHAGSDINLMMVGALASNTQLLTALQAAQSQLGRVINPTLYTQGEFTQRVSKDISFILRVLEQPIIFVKGADHDIA
ncbi:MAG: transcriptional regulator [Undibacterium sp.]|uniref:transcriptional regulator n=1 Tax=Undibacterium sp. TaxID=1914977 RepID=UPI00272099FD|nr:transcriptional regulator [Undibacterium sp.]MDO8651234.1 transcriptional regulator [Undibacterium sp.]